jgi:hypothetical protein
MCAVLLGVFAVTEVLLGVAEHPTMLDTISIKANIKNNIFIL